jgi:two-component system sensor histidine kinase KdpD
MTRRVRVELVLALAVVACVAAVLRRVFGTDNPTTVALALLLVVLATATLGSLWVAITTSLTAMLVFNFFFLPPVGTFTIADPQNWIALVAFLTVGIIASQLSSMAQRRAREALASRGEVARLFDLSRDILLSTDTATAVPQLARFVARRFDLKAVAICLPSDRGWACDQGGERDISPSEADLDGAFARLRGMLEYDARERAYGGHVRLPSADGRPAVLVPLRLGTRPVGLLAAEADVLGIGTLDALSGVVAIAIERINFLREREQAQAVQQRADLASALLASLSHDLRTPLTAIRIAIANIQDSSTAPEERRTQGVVALAEVDRLNRLVQDILDMTRIDAAAIRPEREWVAPSDIVDAAMTRTGRVLEGRDLQVDAETSAEVQVDPRLTSTALAHLIENAAQYSPADRPVLVRGWASQDGLHLEVRDHGPGLDPSEMDHLFERFFRGASARKRSAGTGMGLAIARGLLAAERGRVWGENSPDGGARFSIYVPGSVRQPAGGT